MKLWTLIENEACGPGLAAEHGLSLYMEACGLRLLFDMGQSGAFADNAQKLGIDLARVDHAFLSHGHYDHGGGISRFLEVNRHAPVWLSSYAFGDFRHGMDRFIGLPPELRQEPRLIRVTAPCSPGDGLTLYPAPAVPHSRPINSCGLQIWEQGTLKPDRFLHEQYLMIEEQGKRILISGCSHRGILNIAEQFQPDILIGGFHLMTHDPIAEAPLLEEIARQLLALPTVYYTGHCTGSAQYDFLKERMGSRLNRICTGSVLEF